MSLFALYTGTLIGAFFGIYAIQSYFHKDWGCMWTALFISLVFHSVVFYSGLEP